MREGRTVRLCSRCRLTAGEAVLFSLALPLPAIHVPRIYRPCMCSVENRLCALLGIAHTNGHRTTVVVPRWLTCHCSAAMPRWRTLLDGKRHMIKLYIASYFVFLSSPPRSPNLCYSRSPNPPRFSDYLCIHVALALITLAPSCPRALLHQILHVTHKPECRP